MSFSERLLNQVPQLIVLHFSFFIYFFRSLPLAEVRIPRRAAARAHFLVINKGARQFYLSFRYKVAYNPNAFFLNWKQRTAGKAVEDALQYIKMYVAGV